MSISPVTGAGAPHAHQAPATTPKPESSEVPGAPEHDHDSDDGAARPATAASGRVDVKA